LRKRSTPTKERNMQHICNLHGPRVPFDNIFTQICMKCEAGDKHVNVLLERGCDSIFDTMVSPAIRAPRFHATHARPVVATTFPICDAFSDRLYLALHAGVCLNIRVSEQ
jgi:hypothetical protein